MQYLFDEYNPSQILSNHLNLGGSNPLGEKIEVNSLYLERGGKPWLGVMGEYHFERANRANWYEELCKMKAGGVLIVATYLFWIYNEEEEGNFDFSGDLDVREFVLTAKRAGLDVVLRVGPWAHGECRNGGLPDWIVNAPFKNRDNNPEYLFYVERWYSKIAKEVEGLFYKDGGNIIAVQLDNELVDNAEHLLELKKIAIRTGLIAPLYTVTGWNSLFGAKIPVDEVLPVFGGYADAPWESGTNMLPLSKHYAFYPERNDSAIGVDLIKGKGGDDWQLPYERYPFATCEIGAGMQSTHHRRVVLSGMDVYSMALIMFGIGNNLFGYYMYHGGTNKIFKTTMNESKATGYPNDYAIVSYDFGTCLSEYGEVREQYRLLNLLHLLVNDFGDVIAPLEYVGAKEFVKETDFDNLRYCMRTNGDTSLIFVSNYQRHGKTKAFTDVSFKIGDYETKAIDVKEDIAFILPVNFRLGNVKLNFASAELLCKDASNTYFFTKIPGIDPVFVFSDGEEEILVNPDKNAFLEYNGVRIVVLDYDEARFLRKQDGRILLGEACDVFIEDKEVKCVQDGSYTYYEWVNNRFEKHDVNVEFVNANLTVADCESAFELDPMFSCELNIESDIPRKIYWKKLSVDSDKGFVSINETYDVAQIYADKKLVTDYYYEGRPWRIPAKLIYGKEAYLVMSELKDDCYIEPLD